MNDLATQKSGIRTRFSAPRLRGMAMPMLTAKFAQIAAFLVTLSVYPAGVPDVNQLPVP
ncbi:MAG: hypothetical protein NZ899_05430 [Thermoguttaceae bacterium]|nr:hypothetical protein [Thermoguttaceae bacterium]MDW8078243.1 hypothetical protein [Thermoguttaceae bacterium]